MDVNALNRGSKQSNKLNVDEALEYVWRETKDCFQYYKKSDGELQLSDKKSVFFKRFREIYDDIKSTYMRKDVDELDRHKVVAAQITACIECEVISRTVEENQVFMGLYMIALEVGLNWMLMGLNESLKKAGITQKIEQYSMPKAFACATGYFDIFARNLYYAHKMGKGLNPLDISEKLFLLEYITLLKNGIDPAVLEYNAPERIKA